MTGPLRPMGHWMQVLEAHGPFYFYTSGPRFRGLTSNCMHEAHLFVETYVTFMIPTKKKKKNAYCLLSLLRIRTWNIGTCWTHPSTLFVENCTPHFQLDDKKRNGQVSNQTWHELVWLIRYSGGHVSNICFFKQKRVWEYILV